MNLALFDMSIDEIIQKAAETLDDDESLYSVEEIQEKIDEIPIEQHDFSALSDLTSLFMHFEDITNKVPNACNHSLFHNYYQLIKKKVDDYKEVYEKYEENSDKILSTRQCIKYARWLDAQIRQLEDIVKNQNSS
ncbi:hypothetical protein M9Y10_016431 [Tritrichomonas musculus]|uniref:Uncharacterized protein n=1 Tax=Tritrichomonas musculus TaxID=1915356 RepID=A0ABR2HXS9_9EUKA